MSKPPSDYSLLMSRYFTCYRRAPFFSDFNLAIALAAMMIISSFLDNVLAIILGVLFNFIIPVCFSGILRTMLAEIVGDKASNIKEYLKLNGIKTKTY